MTLANLQSILYNEALLCSILSWLMAQLIKTIIHAITYKTLDLSRLCGDGGMPSGHSATVTALAICLGIKEGFSSPYFSIAAIIAIVVMHDAMGVRREAGRHAQVLNSIAEELQRMVNPSIATDVKLKEFLGHTPLQVIFGSLLGIVVAVVFCYLW